MATDVVMPRLSDGMEEGTVIKWLIEPGAEVKRGDPLVEIETDKANMTYESDDEGTLLETVAGEGDTLPIGEIIARIGEAGEAPSGGGNGASGGEAPATEQTPEAGTGAEPTGQADGAGADGADAERRPVDAGAEDGGGGGADSGERVKASPVARRIANQAGIDLASLSGSGPGGRVVKADVLAATEDGASSAKAETAAPAAEPEAAAPAPAPEAEGEVGPKGRVEVQELTRLQQVVARRMAESKATAPEFQIRMDIDMSAAVALRKQLKEAMDPAPSFNDMVVKACALALREFPRANGAYRDGRFELYERVNIGIAVAAQDALVVPTVFDADKKSLGTLAREARAVIAKVRDKTVTPPELAGGTFTVSNLGMFGVESFAAVINPPQAGILAVGALKKKPVVDEEGQVVARDMMAVTITTDHRILYGADAAEFLARVRELLEKPLALAM